LGHVAPRRKWAEKSKEDAKSPETIDAELTRHFREHPVFPDLEHVLTLAGRAASGLLPRGKGDCPGGEAKQFPVVDAWFPSRVGIMVEGVGVTEQRA
jgi:hypothetical protein